MSSKKQVKRIKGWAVLDHGGKINVVGNGRQWQYPIFYNRKNAKEYSEECHGLTKIIIPCEISYKSNSKE